MRQIGTIADDRQMQRLADYLLAQGIKIQAERGESGYMVWAIDEDRVHQAREEIARFQENPEDERYAGAARDARQIRDGAIRAEKTRQKNVVHAGRQWSVPRGKPVTILLIVLSCAAAFSTGFGKNDQNPILQKLLIASHDVHDMYHLVFRPGSDVLRGQVWRLITPIFIHFGPMHLLMNMMALHNLGTLIEVRRGPWRLAGMVVAIALISNVAQYLFKGPSFGGMSGVDFGLFGYIWMKSEFEPEAGMFIPQSSVMLMLGWLVICMLGWLGPIANYAHFGGLIVGMILGYGPVVRRRLFGR